MESFFRASLGFLQASFLPSFRPSARLNTRKPQKNSPPFSNLSNLSWSVPLSAVPSLNVWPSCWSWKNHWVSHGHDRVVDICSFDTSTYHLCQGSFISFNSWYFRCIGLNFNWGRVRSAKNCFIRCAHSFSQNLYETYMLSVWGHARTCETARCVISVIGCIWLNSRYAPYASFWQMRIEPNKFQADNWHVELHSPQTGTECSSAAQ